MLSETVCRCVDCNTGILLSGGLDTSILAYEAAKSAEDIYSGNEGNGCAGSKVCETGERPSMP
ncbi:MAG: hypothetical protein QXN86_03020 [Candidatus Methanomethylicaceae archaeon]